VLLPGGYPWRMRVSWLLLAAASNHDPPIWPLLVMIAAGVATLRWWRSIGRGIGSLYGTEFPPNPDPAPSRAKREMATMFWSLAALVMGAFLIVAPLAVLVGI
jgi:hypothetical protein